MTVPTNNQQSLAVRLEPTLSPDRLGTYRAAAGYDEDKALLLYLWNAELGQAFHVSIQGVEVALRNCINGAISRRFGADWWQNDAFHVRIDRERKTDLDTAKRRLQKKGIPLSNGQIVATLSFGFWVGMLGPGFNVHIWSHELRSAFPNLPTEKTRDDLAMAARRVASLRNRIGHHEPIFKMNLSEEYSAVMELLGWICPTKKGWIRPKSNVQAILRMKP